MKSLRNLTMAVALVVGSMTIGNAQEHEEGQSNINLGVGFVTFGFTGETTLPPLSLSYEYGLTDNISIGGYFGYSSSQEVIPGFSMMGITVPDTEIDYTYMIIGARGSYHFDLIDDFDTYAGVMLGYNMASASVDGEDAPDAFDAGGGISYSAYIGTRYHFTDNLGAYLEVGYGIALVNVGATFRF